MKILLNMIFISVLFFYLILKKNYIELIIVSSCIVVFSIIYRKTIVSNFNFNLIINRFNFLDFIPIIFFVTIVFFSLGSNYIYTSQDALAMWGEHTRWIYLNNSLWNNSTDLPFKSNIPGVSIYQYIASLLFGFSEKNVALSLHFLTFLTLAQVTKYLTKNYFDYLIIVPVIFIILPLLGYSYVDIMVDGILASIISLYAIMIYSFYNKDENFYNLIPLSIFLVMIKPASIWYLIFVPPFFVIWYLFFNEKQNKKIVLLKTLKLFIILLPALLIWLDWNNYVNEMGVQREPLFPYNKFLSTEFNYKISKVLSGFHTWAMTGNFLLLKVIELPFYLTHIILNLFSIIALQKKIGIRSTLKVLLILNSFLLFNLLTYLILITFHFSFYEAENAASIGRYLGISYVMWITVIICLIYQIYFKAIFNFSIKFKPVFFLGIWVISTGSMLFSQNYFLTLGPSKDTIKDFNNLRNIIDLEKNKNDIKVYFISQGSFGHEASLFFYMLSPYTKGHWCWSITNKKILGKIMVWDCKGSIISYVQNYSHVYLHKVDNIFIKEQKKYFKKSQVQEKKLYSIKFIDNSSNKHLILE